MTATVPMQTVAGVMIAPVVVSGTPSVPMQMVSGVLNLPSEISGVATIPMQTVTGTLTGPPPPVGTGVLVYPTMSLSAVGLAGAVGVGVLEYPALTLLSAGTQQPMLPYPVTVLTGTGVTGVVLIDPQPLTYPVTTLLGVGIAGGVGVGSLTYPSTTLLAEGPATAQLTYPVTSLFAEGVSGNVGIGYLVSALPDISGTGETQNIGAFSGAYPVSVMFASGVSGAAGAAHIAMPISTLVATGVTGAAGAGAIVYPSTLLTAAGVLPAIGIGALVYPTTQLQAFGYTSSGATYSGVAMHTEAQALSVYTNYPFNSFARFNGVYLGAGPGGIFELTGADDDGTAIDAYARVGITDFGTSHLKRVDRMYVGYRTDGHLVLRVFTDEIDIRDYLLMTTGRRGIHGNHVKIGRGLQARYWQFEVRNKDGSDFELDMIEVKPTLLRRRRGGNDA